MIKSYVCVMLCTFPLQVLVIAIRAPIARPAWMVSTATNANVKPTGMDTTAQTVRLPL